MSEGAKTRLYQISFVDGGAMTIEMPGDSADLVDATIQAKLAGRQLRFENDAEDTVVLLNNVLFVRRVKMGE